MDVVTKGIDVITSAYIQLGFMAVFFIVVMALVIWWFVKGRKDQDTERKKSADDIATTRDVIRNNTAAMQCNTEVIKMYGQASAGVREDMQRFDGRMTRQGEQLDGIGTDVKLVLDRLQR